MAAKTEAWDHLLRRRLPPGREHQERHFRGFDPRDGTTMWFQSSLVSGPGWLDQRHVQVPRWAVVWLLAGSATYRDQDGERPVRAGDLIQRIPDRRHSVAVHDPSRTAFWTASLPPGAHDIARGCGLGVAGEPVIAVGRDAELLRRLFELHDEVGHADAPLPAARAAARCLALIVDLLGRSAHERSPEERAAERLTRDALRPFSLEELARAVALSPSRLRHRFAARFGMPPAAWHRRERLRQAHRLLASGDATVDAAARATGWSDRRALTKAFRAAFGYPPGACRSGD